MQRSAGLLTRALILVLIAIMCVGCDHSAERKAAAAAAMQGPEPSFKRIIDSFRRKIEDQPVNLVVSDGVNRTTVAGSNTVSYELTPPPTPNDRYKATVTVTTKSQYSLRHSTKTDENDQPPQKPRKNPLDREDNKGIPLPSTADATPKPSDEQTGKSDSKSKEPQETVARRQGTESKKYELVYENNKWLLLTAIDPKTEKSIQFAFDEALSVQ
jgi:hypothetical protein